MYNLDEILARWGVVESEWIEHLLLKLEVRGSNPGHSISLKTNYHEQKQIIRADRSYFADLFALIGSVLYTILHNATNFLKIQHGSKTEDPPAKNSGDLASHDDHIKYWVCWQPHHQQLHQEKPNQIYQTSYSMTHSAALSGTFRLHKIL